MNKIWLQDEEQQEEQHLEEMMLHEEGDNSPFFFFYTLKFLESLKSLDFGVPKNMVLGIWCAQEQEFLTLLF